MKKEDIERKIEELEKQRLAIEAQYHQILGALAVLKEFIEPKDTVSTK